MDGAEVEEGMTLAFSTGTVSGSGGCNTFSGNYTIENGPLVIADDLALTTMACPDMDAGMAQHGHPGIREQKAGASRIS